MSDERLVLTLTRVVNAPRQLVWDAWTRIEHARHWGPVGFTVIPEPGEVKPGAAWRVGLVPTDGGPTLWQGGRYLEVDPPRRLVMTFAWDEDDGGIGPETEVAVTLVEEAPSRTRLTLRQGAFASEESRDGHGVGWGEALDTLNSYLSGPAAA